MIFPRPHTRLAVSAALFGADVALAILFAFTDSWGFGVWMLAFALLMIHSGSEAFREIEGKLS